MADNPLTKTEFGMLDENVIRPDGKPVRYGWRWCVSCFYMVGLSVPLFWLGLELASVPVDPGEDLTALLSVSSLLTAAVSILATGLLIVRTQTGWVASTVIVSGTIVLATIGFVIQFIAAIEPVDRGREVRMLTSVVLAGCSCFALYLLSHPQLRAGFRIPQSWVGRCVTLGGLLGTGGGLYLIWWVLITRIKG